MTTPILDKDPKVDHLGVNASREDALTLVTSKSPSMASSKRNLDKTSVDGDHERTDEKAAEGDLEKQDGPADSEQATATEPDGVLHGWKMVLVFGALMLVVFVSFEE